MSPNTGNSVEEPLRYETLTGLSRGQLAELAARVAGVIGDAARPGGRPAVAGLFKSVAMVTALMRTNITQELAGDIFGCSQSTVSRRWDLIRPVIAQVLAACAPTPAEILGKGTALVDSTIAPTWDWKAIPDLFSGKAGYAGINMQIAATLAGTVAAVGPVPVHGARHDAHAFAASGLKDLLAGHDAAGDLGYTGVDGITIVPFRTPPGGEPPRIPGRLQQGPQRHPRRRRARRRPPEDLAHALRGRRPLPAPDQQIR